MATSDQDKGRPTEQEDAAPAAQPTPAASATSRTFLRWAKTESFVAPTHGFIPVFLILLLFLLAAVFVKPLFFGILAAVLSFSFEQFLERHFFGTRLMLGLHAFLVKLNAPFAAFRRRITRRLDDTKPDNAEESDAGEEAAPGRLPA